MLLLNNRPSLLHDEAIRYDHSEVSHMCHMLLRFIKLSSSYCHIIGLQFMVINVHVNVLTLILFDVQTFSFKLYQESFISRPINAHLN